MTMFTIDSSTYPDILGPWHDHIKKAWDIVSAKTSEPTLFDLSRTMLVSCGLSDEERKQWVDIAHEIREFLGEANLCHISISVNL